MQLCPLAPNMLAVTPLIALSILASSNTATGLLPPNSSVTRDRFSAEFLTICFAVCIPPVKAMRLILGCDVKIFPHLSAKPVMIFITPLGKFILSISLANSKRGAGAISEALIIIVFPIAKAGANFTAVRNICEFQGIMAATTPTGTRVVNTCISCLSMGRVDPSILSTNPA